MRIACDHDFDIPLDALELAVLSPHLGAKLAEHLPSATKVMTKEHVVSEGKLSRIHSFQADVNLPAFARKVVTPEMCSWDEFSTYDVRLHRAEWTIRANVKPEWQRFFSARGVYVLESLGEGRSRRRVEGDVEIAVPYVFRKLAERLIRGEVHRTFEAEAAALRELATLV